MLFQDSSQVVVAEQSFQVSSETMQDRHQILVLFFDENFLEKPLDRFGVLVEKISHGYLHKLTKLLMQRFDLSFFRGLFGGLHDLNDRPKLVAQNEGTLELDMKIWEKLKNVCFCIQKPCKFGQDLLKALAQKRMCSFHASIDRRRRSHASNAGQLLRINFFQLDRRRV